MKTCVRCWKCQFESWPNRDGFLQEHDCEVVLKAREDLEDQVDKLEEPNEEVKEEDKKEENTTNEETAEEDKTPDDNNTEETPKKKFLRKIRTNLMKLLKTSLSRIQKQMKRRKNLMIRLILNLLRRINQKNQKFTIAKKIIK